VLPRRPPDSLSTRLHLWSPGVLLASSAVAVVSQAPYLALPCYDITGVVVPLFVHHRTDAPAWPTRGTVGVARVL